MVDYASDSNVITDSTSLFIEPTWWSLEMGRDIRKLDYELINSMRLLNSTMNGSTAIAALSAVVSTLTAGSTTGAIALRFGGVATEGLEVRVLDEIIALTTPAASFTMTTNVPAGSVILSVQANLQTIVSATTAVKVGVGVTADPDKYGKTSGLTLDLKVNTIPAHAVLASEEDINVYSVDTNGAAAGTMGGTGESVRVRIVYFALNSLADA